MKTIGLTGGIGMGKSACAQLMRDRRLAVVDTDELARQVVEPGQPALREVQATFGSEILTTDGRLSREALAQRVFSDAGARQKLEAILHPRIRELWQDQLQLWRAAGRDAAVVVIPLLFETRAETAFDLVICVACTAPTQHERLRARGWTDEQLQHRIAAQLPVEEKMLRAHRVIWTEGGLDLHAAQLERILA